LFSLTLRKIARFPYENHLVPTHGFRMGTSYDYSLSNDQKSVLNLSIFRDDTQSQTTS